jgi:putative glutamine amidotransferase
MGGTLYQDLPSEHPSPTNHVDPKGRHPLRVAAPSHLHAAVGNPPSVNSRHHQAVKRLAHGLRAVAWADDGVIEGAELESPDAPWMLAVQWHPEDDVEAGLFLAFARAVARTGEARLPAAAGPR